MPTVTMVVGSGIGDAGGATKVKLAEVVVPTWVNDRATSAGDAVRPESAGPGVYIPVKLTAT